MLDVSVLCVHLLCMYCVCVCVCVCVVCVCVICGKLCVDMCMCTHNCMHMFGVSAHSAVEMCVLNMCNTYLYQPQQKRASSLSWSGSSTSFFNSEYLSISTDPLCRNGPRCFLR